MAVSAQGKGSNTEQSGNRRQTIRLRGFIGKQEILILLDSGSVGTFVSEQLITSLYKLILVMLPHSL